MYFYWMQVAWYNISKNASIFLKKFTIYDFLGRTFKQAFQNLDE